MEQRASSSCSCIANTDALLHDSITRDTPVLTSVNAADGGIAVLAWKDSSHTCIKIPEGSNSGIAANTMIIPMPGYENLLDRNSLDYAANARNSATNFRNSADIEEIKREDFSDIAMDTAIAVDTEVVNAIDAPSMDNTAFLIDTDTCIENLELIEQEITASDSAAKCLCKSIKKSASLKLNKAELSSKVKRSNSLPLLQTFHIKNLHADDDIEPGKECNKRFPSSPFDVIALAEEAIRAAVTPPPSYRSLAKQNLENIPPLYEIVTGRPVHLGPESPLKVEKREESVSRRIKMLPKSSKIFICLVIITTILAAFILVLIEAFSV